MQTVDVVEFLLARAADLMIVGTPRTKAQRRQHLRSYALRRTVLACTDSEGRPVNSGYIRGSHVLRLLAVEWSGHPDYDESWLPR